MGRKLDMSRWRRGGGGLEIERSIMITGSSTRDTNTPCLLLTLPSRNIQSRPSRERCFDFVLYQHAASASGWSEEILYVNHCI